MLNEALMDRPVTKPVAETSSSSFANQREWLRVDDRIPLEYRLTTEPEGGAAPGLPGASQQAVADTIYTTVLQFFAQQGEGGKDAALHPSMRKGDWLYETITKTLETIQRRGVPIVAAVDVTLSGGGIGFLSPRQFVPGDQLSLKMVLPPFMTVQATAAVVKSIPSEDGTSYSIGAKFVKLPRGSEEQIIRHVLQVQAGQLKAKRNASDKK